MTDLKYPLKSNTVPFWVVPVIALLIPVTVFLVYYIIRRDVYDFHHAILGLLFSVLVTGVITDAIKDGVGRPRPDFFWRCFPDGQASFDSITKDVTCTGIKSVIKEGHKSFPSGHTSWSFAGLDFLAWYIAVKFFPPPYHADGWGPHAYFQMLSEFQHPQNGVATHNLNAYPTVTIHPENDTECSPATSAMDTSPILNGTARS
ncbi:hypothetical protein QQ045_018468 [Rhodiola kirilowii]